MENELKDLAVRLYEVNFMQLGDFITKAGRRIPVYFDLRVIISYPQLMKSVSTLLSWTVSTSSCHVSKVCGVPYAALPIMTLISVEADIPMVIKRKETNASYDARKLIEGQFKKGETCMIIDDVIGTGDSIMEIVKDLAKVGLKVEEAVVFMDLEKGGYQKLEANAIKVRSLYTLTSYIEYLVDAGEVTPATAAHIQNWSLTKLT